MHISRRESECILQALWLDRALRTDGSCLCDVGDVLVVSGEHVRRSSLAFRMIHPHIVIHVYM